jgi:hypothetical protein
VIAATDNSSTLILHSPDDDKARSPLPKPSEHQLPKPKKIPTFETKAEEREWAKAQMAGAFRVFAKLGYCDGVAGHMSLRGRLNVPIERDIAAGEIEESGDEGFYSGSELTPSLLVPTDPENPRLFWISRLPSSHPIALSSRESQLGANAHGLTQIHMPCTSA